MNQSKLNYAKEVKRKKIKKEVIIVPIFIYPDEPEIQPCPLTATGKHQMKEIPISWMGGKGFLGLFNEPYEYRVQCELCEFVDDRVFDKNGRKVFYYDKLRG